VQSFTRVIEKVKLKTRLHDRLWNSICALPEYGANSSVLVLGEMGCIYLTTAHRRATLGSSASETEHPLHEGLYAALDQGDFLAPRFGRLYSRKNILRYSLDNEPGSSVSIVSDYGLDNQAIEFRSPADATGFSSYLCVQTGLEVHPAYCTMGTGGPFPGERGRGADHSPPFSTEVVNE
jgi:hypothetical protein